MKDASGNYIDISKNKEPIFGSYESTVAQNNNLDTLWEPGKTQVAYLKIVNAGNLELKYKVALNTINPADGKNLYKAMKYQIVPDSQADAKWDGAKALAPELGTKIVSENDVQMKPGDEHYFALLIHMDENAGNEYMNGKVEFDLTVLATQLNAEADSFGTEYDKDSQYPAESSVTIPENSSETVIVADEVSVIIPENAEAGEYTLEVSNKYTKVNSSYESAVTYDITLYRDNVKVEDTDVTVQINVGAGFIVTAVTHNGTEIKEFSYDKGTGIVSFKTDSFSPFEVTYLTVNADVVVTEKSEFTSLITNGGNAFLTEKFTVEDFNGGIKKGVTIQGGTLSRASGNGNPLTVNTTEKVTFDNVQFETVKGGVVLATRTDYSNIEVKNSTFTNLSAPSTGNTGVQVYANNVTMTFDNCTFNNMPVVTSSTWPDGIRLIFTNCTFNWNGDNCPGFIQIANSQKIQVDINNCKMNYTTDSQYDTAKTMISYNWPEASTININGLKVTGTRNNDKIWKIASSNNKVTINTAGTLEYTFNGNTVDFAANLK